MMLFSTTELSVLDARSASHLAALTETWETDKLLQIRLFEVIVAKGGIMSYFGQGLFVIYEGWHTFAPMESEFFLNQPLLLNKE